MKRFLLLMAGGLLAITVATMLPLNNEKAIAGQAFRTDYSWINAADSTGNVPDTQGTISQAGSKIGLIRWAKDVATITVAVKQIYPAHSDTCTALYDNLATDSVWIDAYTGDGVFDFRKKIYSYKLFPANDSLWDVFTIPSDSNIAANLWFQIRAKVKDSSLACAADASNRGIARQVTISAWGK